MLELIFIFGILLWFTLAVAVGFHAKGHNRSGIIWFLAVGISGVFGIIFYLLAITSAGSEKPTDGTTFDDRFMDSIPGMIAGSVTGIFVGIMLSGFYIIFIEEHSLTNINFIISGTPAIVGGIVPPFVSSKWKSMIVGSFIGLIVGIVFTGLLIPVVDGLESITDDTIFPLLTVVIGMAIAPYVSSRRKNSSF